MNDMTTDPRLGVGGNNPPVTVADEMSGKYGEYVGRAADLLEAAKNAPDRVDTDEDSGKVSEIVKSLRTLNDTLDQFMSAERAPHQARITQINGFFKTTMDKLEEAKKRLLAVNRDYLERKKAEKERKLREAEEKKREEARIAEQKRREAEETKSAASFALNEMERLTREAEAQRAAATSELEIANAVVAEARAKHARVKADALEVKAAFAKRVNEGGTVTDEERATSKADFDAKLAAAKDEVVKAEEAQSQAQAKAKAAREEAKRREEEEAAKAREVRAATAEVKEAAKEAERADKQADRLAAKADGPDADLARTRSLHGAVGTLSRRWTSTVVDKTRLDKDALWPFIHEDAIASALNKWMVAQAPEHRVMAGAIMQEEVEAQVR